MLSFGGLGVNLGAPGSQKIGLTAGDFNSPDTLQNPVKGEDG